MKKLVFVPMNEKWFGTKSIQLPKPTKEATQIQVVLNGKPCACPFCKKELYVAGAKRRIGKPDNHYVSDAGCTACRTFVGELRAYMETFFGLNEDAAIANLGIRIYDGS